MNNSNKTLLQILVEELPKRGGWPEGAVAAVQDGDSPGLYIRRKIKFAGEGYSISFKEGGNWSGLGIGLSWGRVTSCRSDFAATELSSDYATAIVTREQYESAMAASQAVLGDDDARDEILYELANFAATTKTSLDIGVATEIAIWLSDKGWRKQ